MTDLPGCPKVTANMKRVAVNLVVLAAGLILPAPSAHSDSTAASSTGAITIELAVTTNGNRSTHVYSGTLTNAGVRAILPWVVSERAIVFSNSLPGALPMIADESRGTGKGYDRLWIDLDGDGTCGTNEVVGFGAHKRYSPLPEFRCLVSDGGHYHYADFTGYFSTYRRTPQLRLQTRTAFRGSSTFGNREVSVTIRDADGDGCVVQHFSGKPFRNGARICFTEPDDGSNDRGWLALARTMGVLGALYSVKLDFAGSRDDPTLSLALVPLATNTVAARITGSGVVRLGLAGEGTVLWLRPTNDVVTVPVGSWQVFRVVVHQRGQDYVGSVWNLSDAKPVRIAPGGTNTIAFGGPLTGGLTVQGAKSTGRVTAMMNSRTGIDGLRYELDSSGGAKEVGWEVRLPGGPVVASGTFEHG